MFWSDEASIPALHSDVEIVYILQSYARFGDSEAYETSQYLLETHNDPVFLDELSSLSVQ